MAQEDYLSGSKFGQVAGSLLASKRKRDKKSFQKALLASAIFETFGTLQQQQKQKIIDGANDVKEKYSDIFTNNEEIFQLKRQDRANYQLYKDDREAYLHSKAVEAFNRDPNIQRELGVNAFNSVNQETLDKESYDKALQIYEAFKIKEENDIKAKGEDPAVYTSTFTKFNEKAMNAFRAALSEVEDDPTKKSLIKSAFNNIFGTKFGVSEQAELVEARRNAETLLNEQQKLISDSRPPKEQNDIEINKTAAINNTINTKINYYSGTTIPTNFNFQTNKEVLKIKKEGFANRVNQANYKIKTEDIATAVELGYSIPGFSGLKDLMIDDREQLADIIVKVNTARDNGMNPWDEGVLNQSERRIWSIATNQDLNARQASDLSLQINKKKMNELVSVDYSKVNSIYNDENTRATTEAAIMAEIEDSPFESIYNDNMTDRSKQSMIRHVIEGALYLQERQKGLGFGDAVRQAIPIQINGIYQFQEDPFWFSDETHTHEYVDVNALEFMERKNITSQQDAELATYYMNEHRYIQNMDNGRYIPILSLNDFIEDGYEFTVENMAEEGEEPKLRWVNKYIGEE
jgi:hypothetical protein